MALARKPSPCHHVHAPASGDSDIAVQVPVTGQQLNQRDPAGQHPELLNCPFSGRAKLLDGSLVWAAAANAISHRGCAINQCSYRRQVTDFVPGIPILSAQHICHVVACGHRVIQASCSNPQSLIHYQASADQHARHAVFTPCSQPVFRGLMLSIFQFKGYRNANERIILRNQLICVHGTAAQQTQVLMTLAMELTRSVICTRGLPLFVSIHLGSCSGRGREPAGLLGRAQLPRAGQFPRHNSTGQATRHRWPQQLPASPSAVIVRFDGRIALTSSSWWPRPGVITASCWMFTGPTVESIAFASVFRTSVNACEPCQLPGTPQV